MIRRVLPALAVLAILSAATPAGAMRSRRPSGAPPKLEPTATFERPDAKQLLREAKELWHVKAEYTGALAKFNEAVDAEPEDHDIRLQRARFLERLSVIVVPNDKAEFRARAQADLEHIAASDPDSLIGGVARDGLTRLTGESLIEVKRVTCPEPATKARALANSLYGARRYAEAAVEYEKATAGCPDDATAWVDFADSYYVLEDYERAKELFVKALSVDPWNRDAHRYLSDTEVQLKNLEDAVHHLVLAVVSDPTYEAGWSALRAYAAAMDWTWNRVYGDRKGKPGNADGASWVVYEAAKAKARDAHHGPGSALAIERKAVKAALQTARETESGTALVPGPFWSMMARAERANFLDEAIFIHMLNAELAAEYPAFREENAERLASYLKTVILYEAPSPGRGAETSGL
jgi:tetratricopeptide (TPR) repeat protein